MLILTVVPTGKIEKPGGNKRPRKLHLVITQYMKFLYICMFPFFHILNQLLF